jgi:hypothetical protein
MGSQSEMGLMEGLQLEMGFSANHGLKVLILKSEMGLMKCV